jgi:hypothetical protein
MKIRMFALLALPTLLLSGCDNLNRSLLFYTHTNVGIEVGVDPTQQSGKVLIGYKRAEGVVNPVYIPPEKKVEHDKDDTGKITKTTITYAGGKADDVYREEAYSVMAKIAGEANGRGATGQAGEFEAAGKIAQWFATGEAAKLLAQNDFAAAALTGSSETAEAIAENLKLGKSISETDRINTEALSVLSQVALGLKDMRDNENHNGAAKALSNLNVVAALLLKDVGKTTELLDGKIHAGQPNEKRALVVKAPQDIDLAVEGAFGRWAEIYNQIKQDEELLLLLVQEDNIAVNYEQASQTDVTDSKEARKKMATMIQDLAAKRLAMQSEFNSDKNMVTYLREGVAVWMSRFTGEGE